MTARRTIAAALPQRPSLDDIRHQLTWQGMVEQLAPSAGTSVDDRLMMAVLQLETFGDDEAALRTLEALPDDPLARWLLFQVAALSGDDRPLRTWLQAESKGLGAKDASKLRASIEFLRALRQGLDADIDNTRRLQLELGPADRLARQLTLLSAGAFGDLALSLEYDDAVESLVAAHLCGDMLGDRETQNERLVAAASQAPLLVAETFVERAFAGDVGLDDALARVIQALTDARLMPQSQAAWIYSAARAGAPEAPAALDDAAAAAAWRYVSYMVSRQAAGDDPTKVIAAYLAMADAVPPLLSSVLMLRAAERMMAAGDYSGAHAVLGKTPELPAEHRVISELAARYRVFCKVRSNPDSGIGQALLDIDPDSPRVTELALAVTPADDKSDRALLERVVASLQPPQVLADARAHALLLARLRRAGDRRQLARQWLAIGEALEDPRAAAVCNFAGAAVLVELGEAEPALVAFTAAERQIENSSLLAAGRTVAAIGVGEWSRGAASLGELADRAGPESTRLRRTAAELLWYGGDFEGAAAVLDELCQTTSEGAELCKQLANIHLEQGDGRAAAHALARAALQLREGSNGDSDDGADGEAAELFYHVGMLLAAERDEAERAEEALRQTLELDPLHRGALDGLRELLARADRWSELLSVLSSLIRLADDDGDRLQLHLEYASVSRRLLVRAGLDESIAAAGVEHCDHALVIDAENPRAIDNLIYICSKLKWWDRLAERDGVLSQSAAGLRGLRRTYEALDDYKSLARVCRDIAENAPVTREAATAAIQAGDIYLRHFNDPAGAEWYYRRAVELDPENVQPMRRLANVLRELEDREKLAAVLEQLIARGPNDAVMLRLELSALYVESLDKPQAAHPHLTAVLDEKPEHLQALRLLDRVLADSGAPAERGRVLEQLLTQTSDDDQRRQVLLDLADTYTALRDERALLDVAAQLAPYCDTPGVMPQIERIYRDLGRNRELCDFYTRRIDELEKRHDTDGAADLLRRKAEIEMAGHDASEAVDTLMRLMRVRPDEAVLSRLETILTDSGQWQRLVALFENHAKSLTDEDEQVRWLHRAAEIARLNLNDEAELVRINERIYQLAPSDRRAFAVLEKKHERANDHRKLVELLVQQADSVATPDEELKLILRAGAVCEKLGSVDRAAKLYQRALRINSAAGEALEALSRIYESLERWEDLLKVTHRQIKLGGKKSWVALLHFKCGSIMETQFRDDDAAFRSYMEAIKVSRTCLPALHGLRDLHARHGRWLKVAHTLEAEAAVWAEAKGKADVLAQAAEVYATKLGDQERAFEFYERAIKVNPECMPAALALFEYNADLARYEEAAQWGQVCARKKSRWSTDKRARFLVRWGEVLAKLDRIGEAAEVLVKALQLRPGEPRALYGLLALCRNDIEAFDFTTALRDLLDDARERDDTVAAAILASSAGVLAEQRGNVDEALSLYRQAVRIVGEQVQVVLPLADLLVRIGESDEACELVARCATEDEDFERWLEATLWLARHHALDRRDYEAAIKVYEDILSKQPNLDEVRVELAGVHSLAMNYDRAVKLLESAASQLASRGGGDVKALARRYHALGIAAYKSGNLKAAESNWRRACMLYEDWPYPYLTLSKLKEEQGDDKAAERELKLAEQGLDVKSADVMRLQAEYYARVGHVSRAVTLYRKAVKLEDPLINDRVNQARYMMQNSEVGQSIDVLYTTAREQPDYIPTYEQLGAAFRVQGKLAAANRANQVVRVATGQSLPNATPPGPPIALQVGGLMPLKNELDAHPLTQVWGLLDPAARGALLLAPETAALENDEIVASTTDLARLFGVEAGVATAEAQFDPVSVYGTYLLLNKEAAALPVEDARMLVAYGLAALVFGVGEIAGMDRERREQTQSLLAELLLPESEWSANAIALMARYTGRARRNVLRKLSDVRGMHGPDLSQWLELIDRVCLRTGLLVLEDFGALARTLALRAGIPYEWSKEGGLLHTLPEIQPHALFFVSAEYEQLRDQLAVHV